VAGGAAGVVVVVVDVVGVVVVVVVVDVVVCGSSLPTVSVTTAPFFPSVPPTGFCDWTIPSWLGSVTLWVTTLDVKPTLFRRASASAWLFPVTSGICLSVCPFETESATDAPAVTLVPATGFCATT
jgi:hypothetical protein